MRFGSNNSNANLRIRRYASNENCHQKLPKSATANLEKISKKMQNSVNDPNYKRILQLRFD